MLTLIQYPPAFDLPNPSPFCTKVEILLKLANIEYNIESMNDPRKMPNQKLPVIRDGERLIPDSALIQAYLEKERGIQFDTHLSEAEKAVAHAFGRMYEERLYWVVLYSRWLEAENWPIIKKAFFSHIPWPGNALVPGIALKQIKQALNGHGIGRHSPEVIYNFGIQDILAIRDYLGDKDYFMGDTPSSIDATIYPAVASIFVPEFPSPLKQEAEKHPTLKQYCDRMYARFLGD